MELCKKEKLDWNYGPVGEVKKITAQEFWNQISNYSCISIESCQILGERLKDYKGREIDKYTKKEKTYMLGGLCFKFWDFWYVVENNFWENSQTFWKVAECHHEYKEVGSARAKELGITHFGNCYHVYECQKCHKAYGQDSSG